MVAIVLVNPEIPPNTGHVIRLSANTGAELHLVEPWGFRLDDREYARVGAHRDWTECRAAIDPHRQRRWYALTTRAARSLFDCALRPDDVFVFGCETAGLPAAILEDFAPAARLRLPMRPEVRSLNLSNAVAVTVYEAWRQAGFAGSA